MSEQMTFRFSESTLISRRTLTRLMRANAGAPGVNWAAPWVWVSRWKQMFYLWKSEFLELHGEREGWDLQILELACHSCYKGIWRSEYSDYSAPCWHCRGTGVFRRDAVRLIRYSIGGQIFHCPEERWEDVGKQPSLLAELQGGCREVICGLIKHEPVSSSAGRAAFLWLLWEFNRSDFWSAIEEIADDWAELLAGRLSAVPHRLRWKVYFWICNPSNRWVDGLREWFGLPVDDIPF